MKKVLLLIASVAILAALLVLPASASEVYGNSPYFVANQPVSVSLAFDNGTDFYSAYTSLPGVLPSSELSYDDSIFVLGNRSTADFSRYEQWFVTPYASLPLVTSVEVAVTPFVYRPTASLDTLPDLEVDYELSRSVDYQLSYDIRVYTEDGRFVDQYVGGISGTSAVAPPNAFPSLTELIFQGYNSSYVYLINEYSLKIEDFGAGEDFEVIELAVKGDYLLTDTPTSSYELLESPDVPAEVTFEEVGFLNILWNSIKDVFNIPLIGDGYTNGFSLGAILLACIAIPLLIMFLKLILGG